MESISFYPRLSSIPSLSDRYERIGLDDGTLTAPGLLSDNSQLFDFALISRFSRKSTVKEGQFVTAKAEYAGDHLNRIFPLMAEEADEGQADVDLVVSSGEDVDDRSVEALQDLRPSRSSRDGDRVFATSPTSSSTGGVSDEAAMAAAQMMMELGTRFIPRGAGGDVEDTPCTSFGDFPDEVYVPPLLPSAGPPRRSARTSKQPQRCIP